MRWDPGHQSRDVEDRRGQSAGPRRGGAGLGWLFMLLLRTKYGWIVIVLIVGFLIVRQTGLLSGLDDVQNTWEAEFTRRRMQYRRAKLVLFTDAIDTACGYGEATTGPFYCPPDERAFIDLSFFRTLSGRLGAQGQFARAYVIAHEIGHHVQRLLGTSERVGHAAGAQGASVRLELQADCYAGMWARSTAQRSLLEQGDLDVAMNAASRIGDDVLQREATGRVRPESFTHGSAEQRRRWLRHGYDTGSLEGCDTFQAPTL
jgi:uncharacterized protein